MPVSLDATIFFPYILRIMKKFISFFLFSLIFSGFVFSEMKNSTNIKFSVTPLSYNEDVSFGGAYSRIESVMSDKYVTLGGKLYYRLASTDSIESESQKIDLKRAYAFVRPFGTNLLEFAIGKLYSYYLPGSYFSLMEIYTGASRWGKTGIAAKTEYKGFSFGLALPVTESYIAFKTNWGLSAAATYDVSTIADNFPITFGADVQYSATADGDSDVTSVSEKDFSECFSVYYNKKNLGFLDRFSTFLAFSHNAEPYVANVSFAPVANYKNADLKRTNLFSLAVKAYIEQFRIVSETEIGHSVDGDMIPFYTALQFILPFGDGFSFKPIFGYFAAYDTSNSANSFDTWLLYPQISYDYKKLTLTAGWHLAYMEVEDSDYRWIWTLPLSVRVKIGE